MTFSQSHSVIGMRFQFQVASFYWVMVPLVFMLLLLFSSRLWALSSTNDSRRESVRLPMYSEDPEVIQFSIILFRPHTRNKSLYSFCLLWHVCLFFSFQNHSQHLDSKCEEWQSLHSPWRPHLCHRHRTGGFGDFYDPNIGQDRTYFIHVVVFFRWKSRARTRRCWPLPVRCSWANPSLRFPRLHWRRWRVISEPSSLI